MKPERWWRRLLGLVSRKRNEVTCTYCGGTGWYEGPQGGMSTNILCANAKCRHWFNWTPIVNQLDDINRVEPTESRIYDRPRRPY